VVGPKDEHPGEARPSLEVVRECANLFMGGLNADANISKCANAGFADLGVQPGSLHLLGQFEELADVCGVPTHEAAAVLEVVPSPAARLASTLAEYMEDSRSYQIRYLPEPNTVTPSRAGHIYTQLSAVLFGALFLLSVYPSIFFARTG
jgi:hypothetical protein